MVVTRRRGFRIFQGKTGPYRSYLDGDHDEDGLARSTDDLLGNNRGSADDGQEYIAATKELPKQRIIFGMPITTPNSSRFRNNIHSRILQRFPFLIEMFYWIINYAFYRMTSVAAQRVFAATGIWEAAQMHGVSVLDFEQFGWMSFLFPVHEQSVQQWFMNGHQGALTVLNKAYALIHIPGTVG